MSIHRFRRGKSAINPWIRKRFKRCYCRAVKIKPVDKLSMSWLSQGFPEVNIPKAAPLNSKQKIRRRQKTDTLKDSVLMMMLPVASSSSLPSVNACLGKLRPDPSLVPVSKNRGPLADQLSGRRTTFRFTVPRGVLRRR